ncbi:DUF302 domain-containing protein [Ferroplasma sp.]|uniref:DUF302 domain-containing protein n=1 Tax=Ferroplasma sp. TaxID=2591003 RepID=UPI00307FADB2
MFIKNKSAHSFDKTVSLTLEFLKLKAIKVFSVVNHQKNAEEIGLIMENETVIFFGSPAVGTLLMKENPEIGIELPSKLLIYSIGDDTYILYKDPEELVNLYGIKEARNAIEKLNLLYRLIVNNII